MLIATGSEEELGGVTADVDYLRVGDDLPVLLARLREEYGVRSVLCEGGPTLNSHLFAAGLVDELFLSVSPQVSGGTGAPTIVEGRPLMQPREGRPDLALRSRRRPVRALGFRGLTDCSFPCNCCPFGARPLHI